MKLVLDLDVLMNNLKDIKNIEFKKIEVEDEIIIKLYATTGEQTWDVGVIASTLEPIVLYTDNYKQEIKWKLY